MSAATLTNLAGYSWGIGAEETGINIEKFTAKANGKMKEVANRVGLIVGRVDYQFIKKYSIVGFLTGAFTSAIGALLTVANEFALGGVSLGANFLDDVSVEHGNEELAKVTYNLTQYPGILAAGPPVQTPVS